MFALAGRGCGEEPKEEKEVTGKKKGRGASQLVSLQPRTQEHLRNSGGSCFNTPLGVLPETLCPVLFHKGCPHPGAAYPVWEGGREIAPHSPPLSAGKTGLRRYSLLQPELQQVWRPTFWRHLGLQPPQSPAIRLSPADRLSYTSPSIWLGGGNGKGGRGQVCPVQFVLLPAVSRGNSPASVSAPVVAWPILLQRPQVSRARKGPGKQLLSPDFTNEETEAQRVELIA